MDTSKLLNVISDLDNEEDDSSINTILQSFVSSISSSQTTEIIASEKKVKDIFEESKANHYVPSDVEILNLIGGDKYFGISAYQAIQDILNLNTYNIQKTVTDLQDYIKKRVSFVSTLKSTRENLESLNFESYYPENENYQIGLLLPDA